MKPDYEQQLKQAQQIVNAYGKLLAQLDASHYGHPESSLPHDKDQIKSAIHLLLWELDGSDKTICDSLAQSYVYLAQFVPDDEAAIVARGQFFLSSSDFDESHLADADQAAKIVNKIKLEMEALIEDVRKFVR